MADAASDYSGTGDSDSEGDKVTSESTGRLPAPTRDSSGIRVAHIFFLRMPVSHTHTHRQRGRVERAPRPSLMRGPQADFKQGPPLSKLPPGPRDCEIKVGCQSRHLGPGPGKVAQDNSDRLCAALGSVPSNRGGLTSLVEISARNSVGLGHICPGVAIGGTAVTAVKPYSADTH